MSQRKPRCFKAAFEQAGARELERGIEPSRGEQACAFEHIQFTGIERTLGAGAFTEAIALEERGRGAEPTMHQFANGEEEFRILGRFQDTVGLGIEIGLKNACGFGEIAGGDQIIDSGERFSRG